MSTTSVLGYPHFHQIAMYAEDHDQAVGALRHLGYTGWAEDTATLVGDMRGNTSVIQGRMSFNYDFIPGRELEIITYKGISHHDRSGMIDRMFGIPFLSHMSAHVDDIDSIEKEILSAIGRSDVRVVHRFETFNHTNPAIAGKKRFKEVIFGTRHLYGYDTKIIQRLTEGPWEYPHETP
jgi:hypothetical protein